VIFSASQKKNHVVFELFECPALKLDPSKGHIFRTCRFLEAYEIKRHVASSVLLLCCRFTETLDNQVDRCILCKVKESIKLKQLSVAILTRTQQCCANSYTALGFAARGRLVESTTSIVEPRDRSLPCMDVQLAVLLLGHDPSESLYRGS
jgi:hypothetical protein